MTARLGAPHPDSAQIAAFRKSIELQPDYAEAFEKLGLALMDQGKLDEAIAAYRQAIELKPDLINAYATLTIALNAQGKSDEAIAAFRQAVELNPDLTAFSKLGMALAAREQLDKVIVIFRRGIDLKPTADNYNAVAWELSVSPLAQQRHWTIAAEWAARAVGLSPKDGNFWNTLGVARYRAGNWQDAVGALDKSMGLRQGGDASDWLFLSMTHWRLGENENARKWYDKAVQWMDKNQPHNEELLSIHGEAAQLLGISQPQPETKAAPPTD